MAKAATKPKKSKRRVKLPPGTIAIGWPLGFAPPSEPSRLIIQGPKGRHVVDLVTISDLDEKVGPDTSSEAEDDP